jgi:hypothetical protein
LKEAASVALVDFLSNLLLAERASVPDDGLDRHGYLRKYKYKLTNEQMTSPIKDCLMTSHCCS